jgi:hypothetical protein
MARNLSVRLAAIGTQPAPVESLLSRFCRRFKFLLFLSVSLAISALIKNF